MSGRVLLVDDDPSILRVVAMELKREGIETVAASTGAEALRAVAEDPPVAVVLDLSLPDISGKDLLVRFRRDLPDAPVVMLTATDAVESVVECLKLGATDYVAKPFDRTRLLASIRNALEKAALRGRVESLARELRRGEGFDAILGGAPATRKSVDLLRRAVSTEVTVLLEGESGTGKEVAARAVHAEGARRTGPFVAVNCGAIPEGLVESELFGHEKGSFTGAVAARRGRFEEAEGGTIFLDEVGEIRPDLQVRLLRVLQDRAVQRVGGTGTRPVDVRVIAATNRDLQAAIASGAFREDLYYRLAVFPVRLPPLREREGDVESLADAFLARFAARHRRPARGFSAEARRALRAYPWPGNVRELENVVERAVLMEDGDSVSLGSLPDAVVETLAADGARTAAPEDGASKPRPEDVRPLDEEERRLVRRALDATGGNVQEAATRLRISRATIYRKLERWGAGPPAGEE